jgi:hypothetical protein
MQEGIPLSLAVRSHLCGGRLLGQTERRSALCLEAFRPVFTDRGPRQWRTHTLRLRRGHVRGRRGRPSRPLFHVPLTRRHRSIRDPRPLFPRHLTGGASLSLLTHLHNPIGGLTHLQPWGLRRWIGIPQLAVTVPDTLHKITSTVKIKNHESRRNRMKWLSWG